MSETLEKVCIGFLCLLILALVYDVKKGQQYKHLMKDALDLSTKAAALQLDMDRDKIAQGIFDIDIPKATEVFNEYLADNLGSMSKKYILETKIINAHTLQSYKAPNGNTYKISSPTIVSSMKYPYDGILLKKDIIVNNLAASVIKNKNDLIGGGN